MVWQPSPRRWSPAHLSAPQTTDSLCSSGEAAVFITITALAQTGSNIVVASNVSDSSARQFRYRLPPLGITARFVESDHVSHVRQAIDENTKGVFVESISNSNLLVSDIEALAAAAHEAGVPLIV
jgi:O-acetylhomoserine/O-acetylserine sulfhydrylase-like pyridoxal-dependent enzyme